MAGCLGMSRGPLKGNGGRAARCGWGGESELSDKHVEFAHRMQNSGCKQEPGTYESVICSDHRKAGLPRELWAMTLRGWVQAEEARKGADEDGAQHKAE